MGASGMNAGNADWNSVTWREIPGIYKARFRRLFDVLKLSFLGTVIAFATVCLVPIVVAAGFLTGHFAVTVTVIALIFAFSLWLFWKSIKLALNLR